MFCHLQINNIVYFNRAAQKVMPPILLYQHDFKGCWWWYGSRGWTFQPRFHNILLLCDRWAVWQIGALHGSEYKGKVCHWILTCWNNCTHWHLSVLVVCLWRHNNGGEYSEVVGGAFQQWKQWNERQALSQMTMNSCHTTNWRVPQSAHLHKSVAYSQNCVQSQITASMHWKSR